MFFYHCFVAFVCIFLVFFLNFHIFGLVWNYFGEYSIGGACSTQLEEGEVAAQRATDDDDQRQWKRDQTSFWQTSTYLTYLPTWTSRAKEHHFFPPFEIWSVKANLHQMKTSFPYFSFLDVEVKSPPNKTVFFSACFSSQKNVFQFHLFAFLLPFYYFVETSEVSCFKIFIVLFNSSIKLTEPLLYNHDIMISWLSHCSSNIFPTFLPRNWSRARPLGCSRPWMSGPSAPCRGRVVQYFTWGMIWLVPI